MCLLARKWNLEARDKSSCFVLGTLAFSVGNEMYVHPVSFRVSLEVDLDLGEQAECLWGKTK
jgi:hypothetical protein